MDNTFMWVWWALTAVICVWKIGEAIVRPHKMLEWPFLACLMWIYFYVYMAYIAKTQLPEYLGNGISDIGQLMPLLCLIAILAGWAVGLRSARKIETEHRGYPYFKIYLAGLFFVIVGALGGFSVARSLYSGTVGYTGSSGYWVLLFYVGYPGLAMKAWALVKMRRSSGFYLRLAIALVTLVAFMFPHLLYARRGPLFPAVMIGLLVPPLAARRPPSRVIYFGSLAAAVLVMLLFLQVRAVTYNGGTWNQAIQNLSIDDALVDRVQHPEDNEYINNCQLIGTIYQNGKYQYGTGHLSLLWHWIPRQIWKDKPTLGEGLYSFDELFDDVEAATGFHLLGGGAASGGVADTFVQYGVFCPVFWFVLSWGMGMVYVRALVGNSPRWLFCYVGFICATHWLVGQGFAAAFVPGMFFQAVPFFVFLLLGGLPGTARVVSALPRPPATPSLPSGALQS